MPLQFAQRCLLAGLSLLLLNPSASAQDLLTGEQLWDQASASISNLDTLQLEEQLAQHPETVLIDVRNPDEILLLGGNIKGRYSYNIPAGWLPFRIADRVDSPDTPIVVYCGINKRSPLAAAQLSAMGYRNVHNYADGFFVWRDQGNPVVKPDHALNSVLYREPQQVSKNVWSSIGATAPPTYANGGHNNNLSFVVTSEGVLLVNAGDNYLLAKAQHEAIKRITEQPVKYVVWENGQGHATGGSAYWREQGAHIIAHQDAADEVAQHGARIQQSIYARMRDKAIGTQLIAPDETFDDRKVIEMGDERIELLHLGPAHSPGDISVWLPQQKLVIAGDIAFHQRLLPIFEYTDTAGWLETWEKFVALQPHIVIPGHGEPTDLEQVTRYTIGYLSSMRQQIAELLDEGGSLTDIHRIDQSEFSHLDTFDELAALNASTLFRQMEFE